MKRKWIAKRHLGTARCDCGAFQGMDVIEWEHKETGETRRTCFDCDQMAAANV